MKTTVKSVGDEEGNRMTVSKSQKKRGEGEKTPKATMVSKKNGSVGEREKRTPERGKLLCGFAVLRVTSLPGFVALLPDALPGLNY